VANLLNYKLGTCPMRYLGLPVSSGPLRAADWEFLLEKVGHRVDPWQGLFLASAGRLDLTNSCLSSLPMFAVGIYLLHDSTHYAMDRSRARFFLEESGTLGSTTWWTGQLYASPRRLGFGNPQHETREYRTHATMDLEDLPE
jgi:hypothetical protein